MCRQVIIVYYATQAPHRIHMAAPDGWQREGDSCPPVPYVLPRLIIIIIIIIIIISMFV